MLFVETTTQQALTRRLVKIPLMSYGDEPQVIVPVIFVFPEEFGGGAVEADVLLPAKTFYRLARRSR